MADILSVVLRALSFVLMFQAAGIAIFVASFNRQLQSSLDPISRCGQVAAIAAIFLVAAHYSLEAARMAGDLAGMWDSSLQGILWNSSSRAALISRLVGLLLITAGLRGARRRWMGVALLGAILVTGAFTLTGHTSVNAYHRTLAALLMVHLLLVAFWFGALWPLFIVSARETPARAFDIVVRFSAIATWLVPVILLVGLVMAVILLPNLATLSEPYGELLIAKVVGFTLLMGLAAANKWRHGPALEHGTGQSGQGFRRVLVTEYSLIAAVLTITAVMTSFFSPET